MTLFAYHKRIETILRKRPLILGYHGISRCPLRADLQLLQVPPSRFLSQIELLIDANASFVTVSDLLDRCRDTLASQLLVAITFDDGFRNNYRTAKPLLEKVGAPATCYVASGLLGGRSPWIGADGDGDMLDEQEVRALSDSGWEIGAHTVQHADLTLLDADACAREVKDSSSLLSEITGTPIRTFAYPYGAYNDSVASIVRACGLESAVTTGFGGWEQYALPRAMIGHLDPLPVVLSKLTGRYQQALSRPPVSTLRSLSKVMRSTIDRSPRAGRREGL
jgi:peptidoglycan/xylan/chitin deacetylase (PgdA/CDA1 family)